MPYVVFSGCQVFVPWVVNGRFAQGFCPCCNEYSVFVVPGGAYCVVCSGAPKRSLDSDELASLVAFKNGVRGSL